MVLLYVPCSGALLHPHTRDTEPAQLLPSVIVTPLSPALSFTPHHPPPLWGAGDKSPCPQATTAPGLGPALGSPRQNTHSAIHPHPNISPQNNQKIIPSRTSIKGRSSPYSCRAVNQDLQKPHFSFYIFLLPSPFSFPFLESCCFTRVFAPEGSVITAACSGALTPPAPPLAPVPPPSPWAQLSGGTKCCPAFHRPFQIKREPKKALGLFRGSHGVGAKSFNHPVT